MGVDVADKVVSGQSWSEARKVVLDEAATDWIVLMHRALTERAQDICVPLKKPNAWVIIHEWFRAYSIK